MEDIKRLEKAIKTLKDSTNLTNELISQQLGYESKNYVSDILGGSKKISDLFLKRLRVEFSINPEYVRGKTEVMFLPKEELDQEEGMTIRLDKRIFREPGPEPVAFYDADFAGGDTEFYDDQSTVKPAYYMDIPAFSGCIAFRIYGDSMENVIKSGSIVFGKDIKSWRDHLEYGQIYGIICTDGRRYIKYIKKPRVKGKDMTHFLLHSENPNYDDFVIQKDSIKSIWLIHGWLNKKV